MGEWGICISLIDSKQKKKDQNFPLRNYKEKIIYDLPESVGYLDQ